MDEWGLCVHILRFLGLVGVHIEVPWTCGCTYWGPWGYTYWGPLPLGVCILELLGFVGIHIGTFGVWIYILGLLGLVDVYIGIPVAC